MKKILAILLVLTMVFSFAACGNKEDASSDTGTSSTITSTESNESSSSETTNTESTGDAITSDTISDSSSKQNTSKPTESSKPADTSKPSTSTTPSTSKPTETHTHTWGNWSIVTEAFVGRDGTEKRSCSGCNETETRKTTKGAISNSFCDEDLIIYFNSLYFGNDNSSPLSISALFELGDYLCGIDCDPMYPVTVNADEYYKNLARRVVLSDGIITEMKQLRNNESTYTFERIGIPCITHGPVGYIHNGGNKYTVYYEGDNRPIYKVVLEYHKLDNGNPSRWDYCNKIISVEKVNSIPSNIIK